MRFYFIRLCAVIVSVYVLLSMQNTVSAADQIARLYFNPETADIPVGSEFSIDVMVDTAGAEVGGVGVRLIYNPQHIAISKITSGIIFADYPSVTFDNSEGKAVISAIVSSPQKLYKGKGLVATITFVKISAENTTVTYNFTPGKTDDSNIAVMYGTGDILEQVNSLVLQSSTVTAQTVNAQETNALVTPEYTRPTSKALPPLGPLPSQEPISDPKSQQYPIIADIQTIPYTPPKKQRYFVSNFIDDSTPFIAKNWIWLFSLACLTTGANISFIVYYLLRKRMPEDSPTP